jgi:hypothetical protein
MLMPFISGEPGALVNHCWRVKMGSAGTHSRVVAEARLGKPEVQKQKRQTVTGRSLSG